MYSDVVRYNRTELAEREDIEWSNFWWDRANEHPNHRILLMGDSTARMIRSTLAEMSGKPVDLFGTSSALHDSLFINQMDCFFKSTEYQYDLAFVQFGHHAELGFGGGFYKDEDWKVFEEEFRVFLQYLSQNVQRIVVESIFYTVIPTKFIGGEMVQKISRKLLRPKEVFDEVTNERKRIKNEKMFQIAEEMGIQTLDINQYMLTEGAQFRHKDHIHYEDSARKFICRKMMEII